MTQFHNADLDFANVSSDELRARAAQMGIQFPVWEAMIDELVRRAKADTLAIADAEWARKNAAQIEADDAEAAYLDAQADEAAYYDQFDQVGFDAANEPEADGHARASRSLRAAATRIAQSDGWDDLSDVYGMHEERSRHP